MYKCFLVQNVLFEIIENEIKTNNGTAIIMAIIMDRFFAPGCFDRDLRKELRYYLYNKHIL